MAIVKEPSESELVEAVIVPVDVLVTLTLIVRLQLVRVDWVKVASVRLVLDGWLVRRILCPQGGVEVNVGKEWVGFYVVRTVLSYPSVITARKEQIM